MSVTASFTALFGTRAGGQPLDRRESRLRWGACILQLLAIAALVFSGLAFKNGLDILVDHATQTVTYSHNHMAGDFTPPRPQPVPPEFRAMQMTARISILTYSLFFMAGLVLTVLLFGRMASGERLSRGTTRLAAAIGWVAMGAAAAGWLVGVIGHRIAMELRHRPFDPWFLFPIEQLGVIAASVTILLAAGFAGRVAAMKTELEEIL